MTRTNIRKKLFIVEKQETKPIIQTFRHDFGEKFMEELKHFAIVHKYDDRKVFKDAWTKWIDQNSAMCDEEVECLQSSGYKGDVIDKMFKSARYYFRKKDENKQEEKPRKQYVSLSPKFLEQIDIFIMGLLQNSPASVSPTSVSPASAYENFCINKKDILYEQIKYLVGMESSKICLKLKTTFKNRFHVMKTTIDKIHR